MTDHYNRTPEQESGATPNGVMYSEWDHNYSDYFTHAQMNNLIFQRWRLGRPDCTLPATDMVPAEPLETIAPIPSEQPGNKLSMQYRGEDGQLHDAHGRY